MPSVIIKSARVCLNIKPYGRFKIWFFIRSSSKWVSFLIDKVSEYPKQTDNDNGFIWVLVSMQKMFIF